MTRDVNPRPYRSPRRSAGAAETRQRIISAAGTLFGEVGYAATTVSQIARHAGVSLDTVYVSVGRKPELVLAVIDDVLGGAEPQQRAYVVAVQAAPTAAAKLETYASAMGRIAPRVAPMVAALARAGEDDLQCRQAAASLENRRAANMRQLAAELRATGELREDLDDGAVADIIWSTNAMEYYLLLRRRGWSNKRYATYLADLWQRVLLAP